LNNSYKTKPRNAINEGTIVKYKESGINATCYQYSEEHGACHSHIHAECERCGKIFHLDNSIFADAEKILWVLL
jgi:Fur family ferric uptake transcriptional regulator